MTEENLNKVVWEVESTQPELVEPLREALREVIDPELGLNVIELGLIRNVRQDDDGSITLTMILTTPFCPYGPAMLDMTRQKAESSLQKPVKIEMGPEMWDFSMMEDGAGGDWGMYY